MQRSLVTATLVACLALGACATPPTEPDPRDPLERMNRATFAFNDALDRTIAEPIARTYSRIVPDPIQTGVTNFWSNLGYPNTIVNQFLQGKFRDGSLDTARFLLNTVVGVGGLFDPATAVGLDRNSEDFGQTFGKWGIGPGPYLVLPILGPSTVRDGVGMVPGRYVDPVNYIDDRWTRYSIDAVRLLDDRVQLLPLTDQLEQVYDRYGFIRNAYLQQRRNAVHDGNLEGLPDTGFDDELLDEIARELDEAAAAEADAGAPEEDAGASDPGVE